MSDLIYLDLLPYCGDNATTTLFTGSNKVIYMNMLFQLWRSYTSINYCYYNDLFFGSSDTNWQPRLTSDGQIKCLLKYLSNSKAYNSVFHKWRAFLLNTFYSLFLVYDKMLWWINKLFIYIYSSYFGVTLDKTTEGSVLWAYLYKLIHICLQINYMLVKKITLWK